MTPPPEETLRGFLARLKAVGKPPLSGQETTSLPRPGRTVRVHANTYLEHLASKNLCLRLLALFLYEEGGKLRYFWHDLQGNFFVRTLNAQERQTFYRLSNITPKEEPAKVLPAFELQGLKPGERFRTKEDVIGELTPEQPKLLDHLQVVLHGPSGCHRSFLRKDTMVRPTTARVAKRLAALAATQLQEENLPDDGYSCVYDDP